MSYLPKVSIVILNYNGKNFLKRCLSSLRKMAYPDAFFEVLFVDNFSDDKSVEFVKSEYPWVKVICLHKNYGFGGGNNRAITYCDSDFLVFLNNDTEVTENWLINLVQASLANSAPICSSKTFFMKNKSVVEYGGGKFTLNGRGYSVAFGNIHDDHSDCVQTGYPCAASMLIRRDVFLKLGCFDETYFATLDDTDLGWRAWLYGYKVLYCPKSIVYHVAGGTAGHKRFSSLKVFHGTKNAFQNVLKNIELKNLFSCVTLVFCYDFFEFVVFLKHKKINYAKNKINGYLWVLQNFGAIIQKRTIIQKNRKISDNWLLSNGLLASLNEAMHEYLRLLRKKFLN